MWQLDSHMKPNNHNNKTVTFVIHTTPPVICVVNHWEYPCNSMTYHTHRRCKATLCGIWIDADVILSFVTLRVFSPQVFALTDNNLYMFLASRLLFHLYNQTLKRVMWADRWVYLTLVTLRILLNGLSPYRHFLCSGSLLKFVVLVYYFLSGIWSRLRKC